MGRGQKTNKNRRQCGLHVFSAMRQPQRPWLETSIHISLTARQFCSHDTYLRLVEQSIVTDEPAQCQRRRQRYCGRRFVSVVRTKAKSNNRTTCSCPGVASSVRSYLSPTLSHLLVPFLEEYTSYVKDKRDITDRNRPHALDQLLMHDVEL